MTISSSTRKAGPYAGNGATQFAFGFKVFAAADLVVTRSDGAIETPLSLNTDYTVSLNADQNASPGGTVTYPASGSPLPVLPAASSLTITGAISELQTASITNQGGFYPKVIEDALDRAVILIQQLRELANRSLNFPKSDQTLGTTLPLAASRAGKALIFNQDGSVGVSPDSYVNQTTATSASAAAAASSASNAATSATNAAASASAAAASATQANNSAGSANTSASQAQYYAQHGTGFAAGTAYDLGSVADALTLFPTDLGTVP